MMFPIFAALGQTFLMLLLGFVAVFLILLVLVQRGRGGGLAGALGGMGGSSAFGAKAGDVFTKITVVAATVWIVLCIGVAKMTPTDEGLLDVGVNDAAESTEGPSLGAPADESEQSAEASEAAAAESDAAEEAEAESDASETAEAPAESAEAAEPATDEAPADAEAAKDSQ